MIPDDVWRALSLLNGQAWPPETDADADRFIAATAGESLLPLLYQAESLPPAVAAALPRHRAMLRLYQARAAKMRSVARQLCEWLAGVPFIIMKGADYADRLYGDPALRPMLDVDLLVPKERMQEINALLIARGFEPEFPGGAVTRLESYNERSYVGHEIGVDVHHSFVQRVRHRVDYDAVWRECEAYTLDGVPAARLQPMHAFLYHALSMAKDEFTSPLVRYVDFYRFIAQWPSLPVNAVPLARQWRVRRALYGALRQTSRLFPTLDFSEAMTRLLPRSTRAFMDRAVLPDLFSPAPKRSRGRQLWVKVNLLDTVTRRVSFGAYHVYAVIAGRLARGRA